MNTQNKIQPFVRDKTALEERPLRLTAYRQQNGCVAVWTRFQGLPDDNRVENKSYRYPEGQIVTGSSSSETWFSVDDVKNDLSERRGQLYERLWRIDQGLDIDPADRSLGVEAGHYADHNVVLEGKTSNDIFKFCRADACVQYLELPRRVRKRVLCLISNQSLKRFNRFGGLEGAVIGYSIKALAEYYGESDVRNLRDSAWWSKIKDFADDMGITGATGRQFSQLVEYVQGRHGEHT